MQEREREREERRQVITWESNTLHLPSPRDVALFVLMQVPDDVCLDTV